MKRSLNAVSRKSLSAFRRRKVMTLEAVAELVHSSIHTARRRLKEWRTHTSYNQNGRYYTPPDVPAFDADGLWHWRGVFFSRYGNLKQTVVELIRRSAAGLDAGEMGSLLGLDPRSFLSSFADHPQIKREKSQGRFVYYCADRSAYSGQQQRRSVLIAEGRQPTSFEAIAILVEKIKHPALTNEALSRRLKKQKLSVEPETIKNLLVRHGLAEKKTPRSV
ncbi:MAG TPA: hypothetical protein ENH11_07160 [Candidatus Acetothermia bacterium]|nr:hypothetical protein [Candidatus Acetothermia bacterium]